MMERFEEVCHFLKIVGAIDVCHIEIKAPHRNHEDYYNCKQLYSILLPAIVDSELLFWHITIGYPGSLHDSRVLQLSQVKDLAENDSR